MNIQTNIQTKKSLNAMGVLPLKEGRNLNSDAWKYIFYLDAVVLWNIIENKHKNDVFLFDVELYCNEIE